MVSREIAPELCAIYQQSYETGQVLLDPHQANITTIFQKGDKTKPANYRPVSLTCILYKTMEHVIFSQTMGYLVNHDTLFHGFRPTTPVKHRRGPITQTWQAEDHWPPDPKLQKGFKHCAPHWRLLLNLNHYGITQKDQQVDWSMAVSSSKESSPLWGNLHRF